MNKLEILKPFGPSIIKTKVDADIIKKLNDYTELVAKDKNKLEELNAGKKLAGNVSQEFLIEKDVLQNSGWLQFVGKTIHEIVKLILNKEIKNININASWIVRQYENEYNPIHNHSGHFSGVAYLKVPSYYGENLKTDKENMNGKLTFNHGTKTFLCNGVHNISPEIGDFYIFPSYLMHSVYPFKNSKEERRSVSFNALIDENIFLK